MIYEIIIGFTFEVKKNENNLYSSQHNIAIVDIIFLVQR